MADSRVAGRGCRESDVFVAIVHFKAPSALCYLAMGGRRESEIQAVFGTVLVIFGISSWAFLGDCRESVQITAQPSLRLSVQTCC